MTDTLIRRPEAVICSECGREARSLKHWFRQTGLLDPLYLVEQLPDMTIGCPVHGPHVKLYIRKNGLIQQEEGVTQ